VLAAACASLVWPSAGAAAEPWLEVVYVAANEGGSSGGHSALRLSDWVYHYQVRDDGQLQLRRSRWPDFRIRYNLLDNRSLHRARLSAGPEAVSAVSRRLHELFVVEGRHRAVLRSLDFERRALEALAGEGEPRIQLAGAGLFDASSRGDPHGRQLLVAVEAALGADALAALAGHAEAELRALPRVSPRLDAEGLARDRQPRLPPLVGERLEERLQLAAALDAIGAARPLAPGLLIDPLGDPLTATERERLRERAARLEQRVVALLRSPRPDRGRALLVAAARHRAVLASLERDRLMTLDSFEAPPPAPDDPGERMSREPLALLHADLRRAHRELREQVFRGAGLDDRAHNALENAAARHFEAGRSLSEGTPLREGEPDQVPSRAAPVWLGALGARAPTSAEAHRARENQARWGDALARLYDYDLVFRNCATELVRALDEAFPSPEATRRALGGRIAPGRDLSFVPILFLSSVEGELPAAATETLPSYRLARLEALEETGHPVWLRLREGNVFTSPVYRRPPADSAFLLFTDDVFWPRPVYGALNLGYSLLYTGAGLFRLPFDGHAPLLRGVRGALFSLPELVFVNVRKGSFEYLEEVAIVWREG
jgi:hypothetical protein